LSEYLEDLGDSGVDVSAGKGGATASKSEETSEKLLPNSHPVIPCFHIWYSFENCPFSDTFSCSFFIVWSNRIYIIQYDIPIKSDVEKVYIRIVV